MAKSANAIKIQIWITLIANLLLMVIENASGASPGWQTMVRITLMYYVDFNSLLTTRKKSGKSSFPRPPERLPNRHCLTEGACKVKKKTRTP